jgi:hypothetical protein
VNQQHVFHTKCLRASDQGGFSSHLSVLFFFCVLIAPSLGVRGLFNSLLTTGHGTHDQQRLSTCGNGLWQQCIRRFVRQVLFAGEDPYERATLLRHVVTDCPAQHWIASFERVQYRALRHLAHEVQRHFTIHARQRSQMCRKDDPYHFLSRS